MSAVPRPPPGPHYSVRQRHPPRGLGRGPAGAPVVQAAGHARRRLCARPASAGRIKAAAFGRERDRVSASSGGRCAGRVTRSSRFCTLGSNRRTSAVGDGCFPAAAQALPGATASVRWSKWSLPSFWLWTSPRLRRRAQTRSCCCHILPGLGRRLLHDVEHRCDRPGRDGGFVTVNDARQHAPCPLSRGSCSPPLTGRALRGQAWHPATRSGR